MGLFKDMKPCAICGEEVNTSVTAIIASEFIYLQGGSKMVPACKKCCGPLRVRFKHERWTTYDDDSDYGTEHVSDPIKSLTTEEAKQNIAEIRDDLKQVAERIGADNYEVYLKVENTEKLELGALTFGVKKQKDWNRKIVVEGLAQKGTLKKGDDALLLKNGVAKPITLIDVYRYDDYSSFHGTAKAYHGKHEAENDIYCWIVTSEEGGIEAGDVIAIPNEGVQPQPFLMPQMAMQPQGMPMQPQGMPMQPQGMPMQPQGMAMQPQGMPMQPPPMPAPMPQMQQPVPAPMQVQQPAPQQATPKFCRNCGNPLTPGTKFCTSCGGQIA